MKETGKMRLLNLHARPDTVIALQEVSGSLARALRHAFRRTHRSFAQHVRDDEYLVTIAPMDFVKEKWRQHADSANAYLSIRNSKCRIINTHLLPQRYASCNVMEHVLNAPRDLSVIIAGDFNANWRHVSRSLESRYKVPRFGKTYKKNQIDHIVFDLDSEYKSEKIRTLLSDHHMIMLSFFW